jgi:hypothetical protein
MKALSRTDATTTLSANIRNTDRAEWDTLGGCGDVLEVAGQERMVKIELVFNTWTKGGKPIPYTEENIWLSMGLFHGGTVFNGTIDLDAEDAEELREAFGNGFRPTFTVYPD